MSTTSPMAKPMSLRQRFNLERFLVGEGAESEPIFLAQRRVYILPSKMGVYFAALIFVMLLGAVNYNNSLAYALTFLLASIFFIAILHTNRNLLHLSVDVLQPPAVFSGETASVTVVIDNRNSQWRYAVKLRLGDEPHITKDIKGDQVQRFKLPLKTRHRGLHDMPKLTIETSYPLGIFRAWAYAHRNVQYWVYPTPDKQQHLPREQQQQTNAEGDSGKGEDDFAGLRNYHVGDSLRHIHWKSAARGQGMHTKEFGGDDPMELWFDWNWLENMETEVRLSKLTRWVIDASDQRVKFGLRLPNIEIPIGEGPAHQQQCLQTLAMFDHDIDSSSSTDKASQ